MLLLRQDRDADKMPKEMLIWHEQTYKRDIITNGRSNDRFGFKHLNDTKPRVSENHASMLANGRAEAAYLSKKIQLLIRHA